MLEKIDEILMDLKALEIKIRELKEKQEENERKEQERKRNPLELLEKERNIKERKEDKKENTTTHSIYLTESSSTVGYNSNFTPLTESSTVGDDGGVYSDLIIKQVKYISSHSCINTDRVTFEKSVKNKLLKRLEDEKERIETFLKSNSGNIFSLINEETLKNILISDYKQGLRDKGLCKGNLDRLCFLSLNKSNFFETITDCVCCIVYNPMLSKNVNYIDFWKRFVSACRKNSCKIFTVPDVMKNEGYKIYRLKDKRKLNFPNILEEEKQRKKENTILRSED